IAVSKEHSGGGMPSIAVGFSAAVNEVTNPVTALIDDSHVTAAGTANTPGVAVSATSTPEIQVLTIAGAFTYTNSTGTVFSFAGAGAGSGNTIRDSAVAA